MLVADLRLQELNYRECRLGPYTSLSQLSGLLAEELELLLGDLDRELLLGVGIALPGIISQDSQRIVFAPVLALDDVNNIHKHSSGDSGRIIVREHPGFYLLQIRDNGSPGKLPENTDGIGLSGIQDRVQSLGGTLRISTEQGFFINISITKKAR